MLFSHVPLTSFLIAIPLMGTVFLYCMPRDVERSNILHVSFLTAGSTLFVAGLVFLFFNPHVSGFQFVDTFCIGSGIWSVYKVGIDRLNMSFVLAISLAYLVVVYAAYVSVKKNMRRFMVVSFYMQSLILGSCVSLTIPLWFLFSELLVLPVFFWTGLWGVRSKMIDAYWAMCLWGIGSVAFLLGMTQLPSDLSSLDALGWVERVPVMVGVLWGGSFLFKLPFGGVGRMWERMIVMAHPLISGFMMGIFSSAVLYGVVRLLGHSGPVIDLNHVPLLIGGYFLLFLWFLVRLYRSPHLKEKMVVFYAFQLTAVFLGLIMGPRENRDLYMLWVMIQIPMGLFVFLTLGFLNDRLNSDVIRDFHGLHQVMPRLSTGLLLTCVLVVVCPLWLLAPIACQNAMGEGGRFLSVMTLLGMGVMGLHILNVHASLCLGPVTSTTVWGMKDIKLEELRVMLWAFALLVIFMVLGCVQSEFLRYASYFSGGGSR